MRELIELSGASQAQIERWQKRGFLPRLPRAYAGGGGSESSLTEEIVERARLLAGHARQGTLTMGPISLIATLSDPDVALLREAVIENLTRLHHRVGMDVRASSPEEARHDRRVAAYTKAKREGRTWRLKDIATGPVKEESHQFNELLTLFSRDTDDEIDRDDLEAATDVIVGRVKESLCRLTGAPIALPPDEEAALRADACRRLRGAPTFREQCDLVQSASDGLLVRACCVVPQVRRVQLVAVESARQAHALHTGTLAAEALGARSHFPMPYANVQRMEVHPMWERWGSKVIGGAVRDSGDGQRIAVCLDTPDLVDQLEDYTHFLATLVPEQAFHRMAFHRPGPGSLTFQ